MISCYFIDHSIVKGREDVILAELENINPDKIFLTCLEEYEYHLIFKTLFKLLAPYLTRTNKTATLIAPFVDVKPVPNNIIVEDSYGYYHWADGTVHHCMKNDIQFRFTNNTKLFTSYNHNIKYQRAMLVDEFVKYDLLKDGIVTLHNPKVLTPDGLYYEYKYHDGSILKDESDFILNSIHEYKPYNLPKSYLEGFVDVPSESTFDPGEFNLTEKTVKPIASLRPFIVLGPPNYHRFLHEKYDLEYYHELFDYSFDGEEDTQKRIEGIVQNLVRLREMPVHELIEIHKTITDKMIRNRTNFLNIRQDANRFVPKSLRFLLDNTDVVYYGDKASILLSMKVVK